MDFVDGGRRVKQQFQGPDDIRGGLGEKEENGELTLSPHIDGLKVVELRSAPGRVSFRTKLTMICLMVVKLAALNPEE